MAQALSWVCGLLGQSPVLAIALALTAGYLVGSIPFGKFRLGGVAGSLLAGVLVSQFGVVVDDLARDLLFALFIFAVGFDSGPQFFRSLGRKTLREVLLALIVAGTGLATVLAVSGLMGFDKGLAAGIAAGGMTQSAIMGVAGDALAKMGLSDEIVQQYTANIGVGYAVTYIFGTLGAIVVCANLLPRFMGKTLRDAAIAAEAEQKQTPALGFYESDALQRLVGRVYEVTALTFATVGELEAGGGELPVTVEKAKRGSAFLDITPDLELQVGDRLLLVGQREALVELSLRIGPEVTRPTDMNLVMKTQEVAVTGHEFDELSLQELHGRMRDQIRHGVYLLAVSRGGRDVPLSGEGHIQRGDIMRLYGAERDVSRVAAAIGVPIVPSVKTDIALTGMGLALGLLIGMLSLNVGGIPLTLGSGGGALLSGLFFGWLKGKRPLLGGGLPSAASEFMKDFGLAGFVAIVGINSGLQAVSTIAEHGLTIFAAGVIVTLVPLILTMLIGRYLLGYRNAAVFAGALSGSRSANPAFGQIAGLAGNSVPTVPFAVTYALANVFLTLLGPLIVALL